jgi:hypothetical protein
MLKISKTTPAINPEKIIFFILFARYFKITEQKSSEMAIFYMS